MKSINQIAQEDGDSSANEAARIRAREADVKRAWRTIAYEQGEAACTAERVADAANLPIAYVRFVCGASGYDLR